MAEKKNKEIEKAMDIIKEMSMDPKEWELYESRRLAIMDYNTGMEQAKLDGIEERRKEAEQKSGQKKEKIEIAKKMLVQNIDIKLISELTGLSKEEIAKLKLQFN